MRYTPIKQIWNDDQVPERILNLLHAVEDDLKTCGEGPAPRIKGIESDWDDEDTSGENLTIHVQVAPGLVLPHSHVEDYDPLEESADWIVTQIREGVEAVKERQQELTVATSEVRRKARRLMRKWRRKGLDCAVVRVLLEEYQGWYNGGDPGFRVDFSCLGERLQRTERRVCVARADELREQLAYPRSVERKRTDLKIALDRDGADGTIDETAMIAALREEDPASVFASLAIADRVLLDNGAVLIWSEGRVWYGEGGSETGPNQICADWIRTQGLLPSAAALSDAIGRPAHALFDHPMLTGEVKIAALEQQCDDDGPPVLVATLDIPLHRFCAATGRTWPSPKSTVGGDEAATAGPASPCPEVRPLLRAV